MIYAVEGNVNVGKTTFINKFSKIENLKIISETEFPSDVSAFERQMYYINKECQKTSKMKNNNCIMDRSIISTYLYTLISDEFSNNEKKQIVNKINYYIDIGKIKIPDSLIFIIYPFKLINNNHNLLKNKKNTQEILVDYNYYLKYNNFFCKMLNNYKTKMIFYENNRQIWLLENLEKNLKFPKKLSQFNNIVLLDGAPAIGKSTIGMLQNKYKYIEEFKYKSYTLEDYSNQIESIVNRIKILNSKKMLLDTSFLMGITNLFYSHGKKLPKKKKLEIIDEIMKQIPLYTYITKIIYLYLDKKTLQIRKEKDINKKRMHFIENLSYLDDEINFYKKIDKKLDKFSNIHFINANKTPQEVINIINNTEEKVLYLSDLFLCIIECIEEGEI